MAAGVPEFLSGWRGLGRFWLIVLAALGVVAVVLQSLGPPQPRQVARSEAPAVAPEPAAAAPEAVKVPAAAAPAPLAEQLPGRDTPGAITDPDPGLLEPDPSARERQLPRISVDGRSPMHVYAAGFDPTTLRPRVGIMIAGIGLSEAESMAAIRDLPAAATLAVSPYSGDIDRMLASARLAGHEYLLSVPMEPQGYPINDPDDRQALMPSLPSEENLGRLRRVLSRIGGYVGVTSALGPMHGERLAADREQFEAFLKEIAHRGLLFADARPGETLLPLAWNRSVDVVIDDDPVNEATLDARLDALSKLARDRGSALGLVSVPRPKTLERVAAWSNTLMAKGLILAPVSALVQPPAKQEQDK
nr:divergent polysaccharide deacetylase family protein [uncultured Rhodopila sp.]